MISVCIATYNGGKFFKEQLLSVLAQLSKDDEIIVSDDGSIDDTIGIARSFNDSRIVIVENKETHGYVGNFENALKLAKGDYVFLCDQDDIWKDNKVQVVLNYLKSNDLVVHNAELIDGNGNSLNMDYYSTMHSKTSFWSNLISPRYLGCCMAFNRMVLNESLPFVSYNRGHDYWIGCVASFKYKVTFISDKLIYYRRHGNNASSSSEKSNNSIFSKFFKRLHMFFSLALRFLKIK